MKPERTADRQLARLPHYQELVYEFPCNEFEWEANEQLEKLFLCAMGDGLLPLMARVNLQKLMEMQPIDREKCYRSSPFRSQEV